MINLVGEVAVNTIALARVRFAMTTRCVAMLIPAPGVLAYQYSTYHVFRRRIGQEPASAAPSEVSADV
jgi:hypothetical protein